MVWQYKVHKVTIKIPKEAARPGLGFTDKIKENFRQEMWEDQLNKLGMDGWDLINMNYEWDKYIEGFNFTFYLKRAMRRKT